MRTSLYLGEAHPFELMIHSGSDPQMSGFLLCGLGIYRAPLHDNLFGAVLVLLAKPRHFLNIKLDRMGQTLQL